MEGMCALMCGIAGVCWSGAEPDGVRAAVDRMVRTIHHRGPDSDGRVRTSFADVGFKRLSIIDLATGDQPISNEDGSIECFLNGEIYNYRTLRDELVARGHRLRTASDTEVLPHLYEDFGEQMFNRLRGMFIVCIIDRQRKTVLLARDHFGVKQLYYASTPRGTIFASEVKALLASELIEPEIERASVVPYLALLYTPAPHTLVRGVAKLAPGCLLRLGPDGDIETTRYYRLKPPKQARLSASEATERLVHLLLESVRLQLRSDVPLGISLSGGVDSSAVACFAGIARENEIADVELTAITISWPDTPPAEVASSRELCKRLGISHEVLTPEAASFADSLPLLAWISDEPVADPATMSQFRVAEAAASHVRVLLGGAGGDELFGGYGHYVLPWKKRVYATLPGAWQRAFADRLVPRWMDAETAEALAQYGRSRVLWHRRAMTHLGLRDEAFLRAALQAERSADENIVAAFDATPAYEPVNQQMAVDIETYLPEQILTMLDRATMAASVEGRVPFIDVPLVEYCMSLSGRRKLGWPLLRKRILKRAVAEWVPAQVIRGRKTGMPSPFPTFLAQHPAVVRAVLLGKEAFVRTVLPDEWLNARLASKDEMTRSYPVLYALVIMEVWHRLFVLERTYARPEISLAELFGLSEKLMAAA